MSQATAGTVPVPRRAASSALGDAVFAGVARAAGIVVLVLLGAIIVTLFIGGLPAFRAFGPAFIASADWDPVQDVFGAGPAESGRPAIVPGKPEDSELVQRIKGEGGNAKMPPGQARLGPDAIAKILECHYFPEVAEDEEVSAPAPKAKPVAISLSAPAQRRRIVTPAAQTGDICPECGNATLMHVEGCKKCVCGHSEC